MASQVPNTAAKRQHAVVWLLTAMLGSQLQGAPEAQQRPPAATMMRKLAQVDFLVTQNNDCYKPSSNDQITVIFSNQDISYVRPSDVADKDSLATFYFSAQGMTSAPLQFSGSADPAFLGARFIRVVNSGDDDWCSGTLSMRVDGIIILNRVPMYPRKGNPSNGLQDLECEELGEQDLLGRSIVLPEDGSKITLPSASARTLVLAASCF